MQGEPGRVKKWRADHVGKDLSMASQAKKNAEKWILFLSVATWEQRTGYGHFFSLKGTKLNWYVLVHNNLQGDVKEPLSSHIREFLKEDSSLSMGQGRSNTYQILRRNFYP